MKKIGFPLMVLLCMACHKNPENTPAGTSPETRQPAPYDTAAVDSFSAGAALNQALGKDSMKVLPKKDSLQNHLIKKDPNAAKKAAIPKKKDSLR